MSGFNTAPDGRTLADDAYDKVIVKKEDNGAWTLRKANYHIIEDAFGKGEEGRIRATGHANGIADEVHIEE